MKFSPGAIDLFQNVGCSGGPDEGTRALVVRLDVGVDRLMQLLQALEDPAAKPPLGQVAEEPLHRVEP